MHRTQRMKPILRIFASHLCVVALFAIPAFGTGAQPKEPFVVASTSWTAAIARAGGARDILVIAPLDLKHPPEYEIRPSDLEALRRADLVVHAGYERFASRLAESAGLGPARVLQVYTDNPPPVFRDEAAKVAEALGTRERFLSWAAGFDTLTTGMRNRVLASYPGRRAAVHRFLVEQAKWWGFEIVGTFGPGELSPQTLLTLVRMKPDLVIDTWHNVSGTAIAEALGNSYVELVNFPGKDGTRSIEDVFAYNERRFLDAAPRH